MTTTTNVKQVKLNVMNQSQYDAATINPNELYMITDAQIDFNDLANKPTVDQTYNASSTNAQSGTAVAGALATVLPSQTSQSGKFLTTNGATASWANIPEELPTQSGQNGKFLTTNGTSVSWADIPEELPSQTSQSGKYLTTNGTTASWANVPASATFYWGE